MGPVFDCSGWSLGCFAYSSGTAVTLTAVPVTGSTFTGWSGNCTGTGTCSLTMNANKSASANFNTTSTASYSLSVNRIGTGTGTVTSNIGALNCGVNCTRSYVSGTTVVLTAMVTTGSTFGGWGPPCSGTGTCSVTLTPSTGNITVDAIFNSMFSLSVSKTGLGSGQVTSAPSEFPVVQIVLNLMQVEPRLRLRHLHRVDQVFRDGVVADVRVLALALLLCLRLPTT